MVDLGNIQIGERTYSELSPMEQSNLLTAAKTLLDLYREEIMEEREAERSEGALKDV